MAKRKKILQQGYEIFIKILGSIVLLAALVLIVMKIIDADKYKSVSFEYLVVLIVALLVLPSLSQIEAFGVKLGIREKVESLSARFEALPDYIIASDYYQQQDYALAEESLHKSLHNDPEFWPSQLCLGAIASFKGDYYKAIASYKRVLEIDENNCYALNNLADIYVDSPPPIFDPGRALDYANKTLEIRPELESARLMKAEALNRLGKTDEAEPILLELIENRALPSQNHWILYELAIVKSRRGGAISINEIDNMYHIAIANEEREDFIDVLKERAHLFSPKNQIQIKRFLKKTESTR